MKIKFSMPVIMVHDIDLSKRFYQDLFGLKIEHDFGENIAFECGLSLWEKKRAHEIIFGHPLDDSIDGPQETELYFESDDLEEMQDRINSSGAEMIHPIKVESWGQRSIRFYDPDGFIIEVGEPIKVFVTRMKDEGLSLEEVANKAQLPLETVKEIIMGK